MNVSMTFWKFITVTFRQMLFAIETFRKLSSSSILSSKISHEKLLKWKLIFTLGFKHEQKLLLFFQVYYTLIAPVVNTADVLNGQSAD